MAIVRDEDFDRMVRDYRHKYTNMDRPMTMYGESTMSSTVSTSAEVDGKKYVEYIEQRMAEIKTEIDQKEKVKEAKRKQVFRFDPEELIND